MRVVSSDPTKLAESVHVINDEATGVSGVIAIHSTALGPAAGGCRFWHYDSHAELVRDAMRLAQGMSYKNAMAGLPLGGGKAVLQKPTGEFDRATVFRVFADAVAKLDGLYITAEDVGTTVNDMLAVSEHTTFVAGLDAAPGMAGGDPSPWTALGVFESMRAAADAILERDLSHLTVAVQGTGSVGAALCRLLRAAGAELIVADVDEARAQRVAEALGAKVVNANEIHAVKADIFSPCALGAGLNETSIPQLQARLIVGAANNQLATPADGDAVRNRGIAYAPDYVVNAGGIINVSAEYLGETTEAVRERISQVPARLLAVFDRAQKDQIATNLVADQMAQELIAQGRR